MTPSEALTGIISFVGAGGVRSIVVGFEAFKTEAAKGRRKPFEPADVRDANGTVPGSHDIELLAHAASQVAGALGRLNILAEYHLCRAERTRTRSRIG